MIAYHNIKHADITSMIIGPPYLGGSSLDLFQFWNYHDCLRF